MVLWCAGPLVRWSLGPLVLWSAGPSVSWSFGPLVLWSAAPLVRWPPGPLVCWSFGPLVLGSFGPLVLRSAGPLVRWSLGALVLWSCRNIRQSSDAPLPSPSFVSGAISFLYCVSRRLPLQTRQAAMETPVLWKPPPPHRLLHTDRVESSLGSTLVSKSL